MDKIPPRTGWLWIKEGFALFRRRAGEMSTLFLAYMLLVMLVGSMPVLGQVLPVVLIPVFSVGFMMACARIEAGQRVTPRVLAAGFAMPGLRPLLLLGLLYVTAISLAIGASSLFDDGAFLGVMSGRGSKDLKDVDMMPGMLVAALLYIPAAMAFWYAAPLIAWHRMGVGKAVFYSFFAVWRAGRAFLVYVLGWVVIGVLLPVVVSSVIGLVLGNRMVSMLILLPLSILLTVVMYCSFYPTYTSVFGRDHIPPPSPPPAA
ncbi:MAG: rane protein [Paucimonas sp.]|nr:rane protein [Paucimonas sp.]